MVKLALMQANSSCFGHRPRTARAVEQAARKAAAAGAARAADTRTFPGGLRAAAASGRSWTPPSCPRIRQDLAGHRRAPRHRAGLQPARGHGRRAVADHRHAPGRAGERTAQLRQGPPFRPGGAQGVQPRGSSPRRRRSRRHQDVAGHLLRRGVPRDRARGGRGGRRAAPGSHGAGPRLRACSAGAAARPRAGKPADRRLRQPLRRRRTAATSWAEASLPAPDGALLAAAGPGPELLYAEVSAGGGPAGAGRGALPARTPSRCLPLLGRRARGTAKPS